MYSMTHTRTRHAHAQAQANTQPTRKHTHTHTHKHTNTHTHTIQYEALPNSSKKLSRSHLMLRRHKPLRSSAIVPHTSISPAESDNIHQWLGMESTTA